MKKLPIGLQLYTLRNEMEQDVVSTLEKVAELGYQGVEFAGYFGQSPDSLRDLLSRLSLKAISSHASMQRLKDHLEEEIAMCVAIGSRYVVCPGISREDRDALPESVAFLVECANRFAEHGIGFAFHNHWAEFEETYGGRLWFDAFFGSTPAERMKIELDVCWITRAGYDPLEYLRKYAGRVPLLHLKDMRRLPDGEVQTVELGRGDMDLPAIMAAAAETGSEWLIVEQDDCEGQALESVRMSREWLRTQG